MTQILLNPGPVTLSRRVRAAMLRPDICHRESEFSELQEGLRKKLLEVYELPADNWAAVLLTGSGTAAVEAMITSCVPTDGHLLIVENGAYGERMSRIAKAYAIPFERVSGPWDTGIDLENIEKCLTANSGVTHIAAVHHETTSGRLNDIGALGDICRRAGVRLLLDGVSSFGAEALKFEHWQIDACAATANKCLHGVPGTAFVIARRGALLKTSAPSRSVYLDLHSYLTQQDEKGTPFTQSVQTFYALDEALDEFFEAGGWQARHSLFATRLASIRQTLVELGIEPLLHEDECSCVLHAFALPRWQTYTELHRMMKERSYIIYAGQGSLSGKMFRISAMGEITRDDLKGVCAALIEALRESV